MNLVWTFLVVFFVSVLGCTPTKVHVFGAPSKGLIQYLQDEKYKVEVNRQHADFEFKQNVLIVPLGYGPELVRLVDGLRSVGVSIDKQVYGSLKDHHYHRGNIGLYLLSKKESANYMSALPAVGENRFKKYMGRYYSIDCETPVELALLKSGVWLASTKDEVKLAHGRWDVTSRGLVSLEDKGIWQRYSVMDRPDLPVLRQLIPVDHHKLLWRCQYRGPIQ